MILPPVPIFDKLFTRCSPYLRHMGYLDEAVAMRGRYLRRRAFWQLHLENTRRFVLSSARKCRTRDKLVILGSGLLLDLPLAELASLFREVVLIDVVCLPAVRNEIRQYANAAFVEHDVTNVARRLYRNRQEGSHELPQVTGPAPNGYEQADLVVSLNILSQLWVIPRAYAMKPFPRVSEDQLDDWCREIVQAHYLFLRDLPSRVCLVGDYAFVKRNREGDVLGEGSTIAGFLLPRPDEAWTWNIEPFQSGSQFHSKELIVGAWHLEKDSLHSGKY